MSVGPTPWDGPTCNKREHVISKDEEMTERYTIAPDDERRFRCDCGLVMIGNGHIEVRYGLLPYLYPGEPT